MKETKPIYDLMMYVQCDCDAQTIDKTKVCECRTVTDTEFSSVAAGVAITMEKETENS